MAVEQLQRKLALNSAQNMTQLQSHPIAVTTPPASLEAHKVQGRKANFSHGGIPSNVLIDPRVRSCRQPQNVNVFLLIVCPLWAKAVSPSSPWLLKRSLPGTK